MAQLLWFCMKTLRNVVDSHSANCFKLERGPAEQCVAGNGVAVLIGVRQFRLVGRRIHGALSDRAYAGSKIAAVAQWIQLDAEYRANLKGLRRNPLLCHRCRARHLDTPLDVLPVGALGQSL